MELKKLSEQEWESLCKQCGKCCYIWLDNRTRSTEACPLLNKQTNKCTQYEDRHFKKLEITRGTRVCVKLLEKYLKHYYDTKFLPEDCAYIQYYLKNKDVYEIN